MKSRTAKFLSAIVNLVCATIACYSISSFLPQWINRNSDQSLHRLFDTIGPKDPKYKAELNDYLLPKHVKAALRVSGLVEDQHNARFEMKLQGQDSDHPESATTSKASRAFQDGTVEGMEPQTGLHFGKSIYLRARELPGLEKKADMFIVSSKAGPNDSILVVGLETPSFDVSKPKDGEATSWHAYALRVIADPSPQSREVWAEVLHNDSTRDKAGTYNDRLSILTVKPNGGLDRYGSGLQDIVTVKSDEEAISSWFLGIVQREEALRDQTGKIGSKLEIDKKGYEKLLRAISELLRFRLSGEKDGAMAGQPSGLELAQYLRWPMWINGSDAIGAWVMFSCYAMTIISTLLVISRVLVVLLGTSLDSANGDTPPVFYFFSRLSAVAILISLACVGLLPTPFAIVLSLSVFWFTNSWYGNISTMVAFPDAVGRIIEYLLPAAGFLGTIAGLGKAFGSVGIISDVLSLQKQALMGVLLDLGTAFSTTFFALAAGMVIVPLQLIASTMEDSLLKKIEDQKEAAKVCRIVPAATSDTQGGK